MQELSGVGGVSERPSARYQIKIWFLDGTKQVLASSGDFAMISKLWVAWRAPITEWDGEELFQWELMEVEESRQRCAFVGNDPSKVTWSEWDIGPDEFRSRA